MVSRGLHVAILVGLIFGFQGQIQGASQELCLSDFLREMASLDHFTAAPDPWYETVQYSSYDRRSKGAYEPGWYANSDGFGNEPIPGVLKVLDAPTKDQPEGRFLLVDETEPGVMVRTWTARMNGTLKVWLDGNDKPLFDGPAQSFMQETFKVLGAVFDPDFKAEIDPYRQRDACYFPLPYAKQLRIEWTGRLDQLHFYHIEVRRYTKGTPVQSLDQTVWAKTRDLIDETGRILLKPGEHLDAAVSSCEQSPLNAVIQPGEELELLTLDGAREVVRLDMHVNGDQPIPALRQTILRIYFDDSSQPQVEAPLGDFFGSAPGVNPYDSVPFTVRPDGTMVCRFPMPFAAKARVVALNFGAKSVTLDGTVFHRPFDWQAGASQHFFAGWSVDHGLTAGPAPLSFDLAYFTGRGRGLLVGVAAMIMNPCSIPTSYGNWWGEGDEKIFVDDDPFPVFFGTGSEDYYNYSWSSPDLFAHAYCGQTHNTGPGNRGFVANHRWHILDPIPFQQRLDFYMELMHHVRTPDLSYARIAYVYAQQNLRDSRKPITKRDVQAGLELPTGWLPEARMGANGGIFVQAEDCDLIDEGRGTVSLEEGQLWAGGLLGVWRPSGEGDRMEISFPVEKSGKYQLNLACAKSPESGAAQIRIDGNTEGDYGIDLYQEHQTILRSVQVLVVELEAGIHRLEMISRGAHPKGDGMQIGVDYIWLQPR